MAITKKPLLGGALNPNLPNPTLLFTGDNGLIDQIQKQNSTLGGSAALKSGIIGNGVSFTTSDSTSSLIFNSNSNLVFPDSSNYTIVLYKQKLDTTLRSYNEGYADNASTSKIIWAAPFSDGNIYFDGGNATTGAGGGRIVVSGQTFDTKPDSFVFVASATRGREVYRKGSLIGSASTSNFARTSTTTSIALGRDNGFASGTVSDLQIVYLLAIYPTALTVRQCLQLSDNPGLVFAQAPNVLSLIAGIVPQLPAATNDVWLYNTATPSGNDVWLQTTRPAASGTVNYSLTCATGTYSVAGQASKLTRNYQLACATGTYSYTGVAATLNYGRRLACATGSYALTGVSANLTHNYKLVCATGSYSIAGQAAKLTRGYQLTCATGAYNLTGVAATLTYTPGSGGINYSLTCATGSYSLSGVSAQLTHNYRLNCAVGSYSLAGLPAIVQYGRSLTCQTGLYNLTGVSAILTYTPGSPTHNYSLLCSTGSYVLNGLDALFTFSGAPTGKVITGAGVYRKIPVYHPPVIKRKEDIEKEVFDLLTKVHDKKISPAKTNERLLKLLSLPRQEISAIISKARYDELSRNSLLILAKQIADQSEQQDEEDILMLL